MEATRRLEQMLQENQDLVNPEIDKVTGSIAWLREDIERATKQYESENIDEEISTHITDVAPSSSSRGGEGNQGGSARRRMTRAHPQADGGREGC